MAKLFKAHESIRGGVVPFERRESASSAADANAGEEGDVDPSAVLAEARQEAERMAREAHEEGLRIGTAAGEEQFWTEVGQASEALAAAADAIRNAHEAFLGSLEPQVIALVQAISARVLQREASVDGELIVRTVRQALRNLTERAGLIIRLNPKDLEAIRNRKLTLMEEFEGIRQIDVIGDDTVHPGGCLVESQLMQVDAQLDAQLERIFEALVE